jgi:O-succinylbenzoic acid--CoA ligase
MNVWITNPYRLAIDPPPIEPYFRATYDFAQAWLRGESEFVLNTSGSTGTPKPISLQKSQMEASARMTGRALDLPANTQALVCLNTAYIAGRMMLVRGLVLDWEICVVKPVANPLSLFGAAISFDFVAMVPLQLAACLADESTRPLVERCGKILLGGAPVSWGLESQIQHLKVPVFQSYGMTETVSHVALRRVNGPGRTEAYQILGNIDFGVDDRGCLWVRGAVTNFDTIQTNDLVALKPGGTFLWLGRADSVINSGGVKIMLDKLERIAEGILHKMDVPNAFFLWHEDDERLGQKLVLFLEKMPVVVNVTELLANFADRVDPYEVPKAVYFVEKFKNTPTAKLDKKATARAYFAPNSDE